MNRSSFPVIAALAALSAPLWAARAAVAPLTHPTMQVFEAYRTYATQATGNKRGYLADNGRTVTATPGVLSIVPGPAWANFVRAAEESPSVPYAIKNVVLEKKATSAIQCADVLAAHTVRQQGTPNIRLWWPLMYETAGTTWTLTILYGTTVPYDDDGPGPNPAGYVHTETWGWKIEVTLDSMKSLVALFRELPFGPAQSPLISDETLYSAMQSKLDEVNAAILMGDSVTAGLSLGEFEMLLMDRCLPAAPTLPNPTGPGAGIAQSTENPACCKLLTDAEYLGFKLGIYQPTKR